MLFQAMKGKKVQCNLCSHRCIISDGKLGICRVRENNNGILYTKVSNRTIAQNIDPIEKKPLLHFQPGSLSFSVAAPGCNFTCEWCQNWEISQMPRTRNEILGNEVDPNQIVSEAKRANCRSIAYTYTEPTIFFEFAYKTAKLAHKAGLKNVFVTNGFMTSEMIDLIHPYLDGANVDLKSFSDQTYKKYVGARLEPVLRSLKQLKQLDIWLEITTLLIPGINDDEDELRKLAHFIVSEVGEEVPWHISRFFPNYKMNQIQPTPIDTIFRAKNIGKSEGLRHIYLGNLGAEADTECHNCGMVLIQRSGYGVINNYIDQDGRCPKCQTILVGVDMNKNAV